MLGQLVRQDGGGRPILRCELLQPTQRCAPTGERLAEFSVLFGFRSRSLLSWAVELENMGTGAIPRKCSIAVRRAAGQKLTREPNKFHAQLEKQTGVANYGAFRKTLFWYHLPVCVDLFGFPA